MLRKYELKIRKKLGVDGKVRAVVGEALALVVDGHVRSQRKRLREKHQTFNRILFEERDTYLLLVSLLGDVVVHEPLEVDERIEGGNLRSCAERRSHDAACACSWPAATASPAAAATAAGDPALRG